MKNRIPEVNSNKGDDLIIKNTPAVTSVAAWINADTGVGPSIASGNHVCKPNCADLPIEPKNKKKQIVSNTKSSCPKNIKVTLEKKKVLKQKLQKNLLF